MKTFLGIALVALVVSTAPAGAFHANDLQPVHTLQVPGDESRAARVALVGPDLAVDIDARGPITAAQGTVGINVYDVNGARRAHVSYSRLGSPDRVVLAALPEASIVHDVSSTPVGGGSGACSFICLGIRVANLPAGEYAVVAWAANVGGATFDVLATGGGHALAENEGSAVSLGDHDFQTGSPNAQLARTLAGQRAGVKVMQDARFPADVAGALHGILYAVDFKTVCSFALATCVYENTLKNACARDLRVSCETTRLSWTGPTGGQSGRSIYGFDDLAAGAYSFNVDLKLDVYGPRAYEANSGTFAYAGDDYTILTFADVAVP